jgi:hypothetical protein
LNGALGELPEAEIADEEAVPVEEGQPEAEPATPEPESTMAEEPAEADSI